ncbi:MAG TPA: hypothetical protein PKB15_02680 [Acidimicrobiia bacterium]|jgi:hypothetical protein|nr:hypothetical protein [Acidimicrobiia bacterium]
MEVAPTSALTVSGNPTDDEIAAITAAYSYILSRPMDKSVDNPVHNTNLWAKSLQGDTLQNSRLAGNMGSWVTAHRLRSR